MAARTRFLMAVFLVVLDSSVQQTLRAQGNVTAGKPWPPSPADKVINISGNYPHLTVYNSAGECGIGAVAPWADKLWFITYPPHKPEGSDDKLYTVDANFKLEMRPESVGGTHASRMIHEESQQLILGPYFIDARGKVRVPDLRQLRARLTATTRHLTDPKNKVCFVGMERELYEVDVHTLAVNRIYGEFGGPFPGTHGKGAYVSHGRLIAANNGDRGWSFARDSRFESPAGCLAETTGKDWKADWTVIERKSFCEVTGPGGLAGHSKDDDRVWATGWDRRSVLLKLLDDGRWHTYRLPKASYSHDALHGWYTEWPRIRELGSGTMLMHMHGMFYQFPKTFAATHTGGLQPISSFLKMPVDYCGWRGQVVMARDDASLMQNELAGQSHSSLWFGQISDLREYGPPAGWGGVWINDTVRAGEPSVPFLVNGFAKGTLHLTHAGSDSVDFTLEADASGRGSWKKVTNVTVPPLGYRWWLLPADFKADWLRLTADRDTSGVTAYFHLANPPVKPAPRLFKALADVDDAGSVSDGIIKPSQGDARTLIFAANRYEDSESPQKTPAAADRSKTGSRSGFYEIGGAMKLERVNNPERQKILRGKYAVSRPDFTTDAASVIVTEGDQRFRLPKGAHAYDQPFAFGWPRGKREVVTERYLLNAHGTFYELPRADAGGCRRLRPVTSHRKCISDFCRWRGLLVLAGVSPMAANDGNFFRSEDGLTGLWFGDVDDLWRMGPPAGIGGPWKDTEVTAGGPSDPYLMTGYNRKVLELSHDQSAPVIFTVEMDFLAEDAWSEYAKFTILPGQSIQHTFPDGYSAHWVRLRSNQAARVTATFTYSN